MLFIHNDTVAELLSMPETIEVLDRAFRGLENGRAMHRPRLDFYAPCERPDGYWRWGTMEGVWEGILAIRMKSDVMTWPRDDNGNWTADKYCVRPGAWCGLVMLFSTRDGAPLAFINDGVLQHMRVGAGAGIGARLLSRENSRTVGMIGSGGMARTYATAFHAVRNIKRMKVYSPTTANREAFAREMSAQLDIDVTPVSDPEQAASGADILASATDSMQPTIDPSWIEPGMHLTNVGPFEFDQPALDRVDIGIRQGVGGLELRETEQAQAGIASSPMAFIAGNRAERERLPEKRPHPSRHFPDFNDLVSGRTPGRTSDGQVTFYHNTGNQGLQFAAVGGLVLAKARAAGLGRELPTDWFLQNIRD